jgi:hypothetical protein
MAVSPEPTIGPPSISGLDEFWIEVDDHHEASPIALLSCRRCGVHHVLWPDANDNPPTLAAVIELALGHAEIRHA